MMVCILIAAGCVMETTPNIVILAPILKPLADNIGMNEIQFCIMMITALGVGFITPPLGLNLFVVSGITGESILKIAYRADSLRLLHAARDLDDRLYAGDLDHTSSRYLQIGRPDAQRISQESQAALPQRCHRNPRNRAAASSMNIEAGGDAAALDYAKKFDNYDGEILLSPEAIEAAAAQVPEKLRRDIEFSHANVKKFAEAQLGTVADFETEVVPGLIAGQKAIPVNAAGCYVPGGRYSHIASAIMTVTTAKVAGCKNIVACSPPRPGVGIAPAIVYAAHVCGADKILAMGGVQGVAAMTFGLFGLPKANILVGPGNQFVAEAKRMLFGRVGIDMIAGPTDSLILADAPPIR